MFLSCGRGGNNPPTTPSPPVPAYANAYVGRVWTDTNAHGNTVQYRITGAQFEYCRDSKRSVQGLPIEIPAENAWDTEAVMLVYGMIDTGIPGSMGYGGRTRVPLRLLQRGLDTAGLSAACHH